MDKTLVRKILDAVRAEDQSEWQQYDVCDQQGWLFWTGMVR